jgi:hypothetical protein
MQHCMLKVFAKLLLSGPLRGHSERPRQGRPAEPRYPNVFGVGTAPAGSRTMHVHG